MRLTIPRAAFLLLAVALLGYAFVVAPRVAQTIAARAPAHIQAEIQAQSNHEKSTPAPFPPAGQDFIGVTTSAGPSNFSEVDKFTKAAGRQPTVMMFSEGWAVDTFSRSPFDEITARGMLPILSWEPWDYRDNTPNHNGVFPAQPKYRLSNITRGAFDAYIRSYAEGIKSLGYTVGLRFAHEMNGNWYPWGANVNGNRPGDYVAAWRHVHDIFTAVGATNVIWVWSPNVEYTGAAPLKALYPGNAYVDWVGLSGYYGTGGLERYETFDQIFDKTFRDLATITSKPIIISETGATNSAGLRSQWIKSFFTELPKHPNVIGFIWFEAVKELDWRILTPPAAGAAFSAGAASPFFATKWAPGMVGRSTTG